MPMLAENQPEQLDAESAAIAKSGDPKAAEAHGAKMDSGMPSRKSAAFLNEPAGG